MSGAQLVNQQGLGALTYVCSANAVPSSGQLGYLAGGQLVKPDPAFDGTILPTTVAGAGLNNNVLGVAMTDAVSASVTQTATFPDVPFNINLAQLLPYVAVAWEGTFRLMTSSAFNLGDFAVADIYGQVKKYTAGTSTYDQIVAQCTDPAGSVASGAFGIFTLMLGK